MQPIVSSSGAALAVCSLLLCVCCAPAVDVEAETAAVKAALDDYFEGAKAKDIDRIARAWADDPDINIISPFAGLNVVGWEQYRQHLDRYFDDESFAVISQSVRDQKIKIARSGLAAWFSETVDEEFEFQGETSVFADMRWTGILEKRDGIWKIVQIHVSFARPEEMSMAEVRRMVEEENAKHIDYVRRGDPALVASQYTEDAVRYLPEFGLMHGREGVVQFWTAVMPMEVTEFTLTTENLSVAGDYILELGRYSVEAQSEALGTLGIESDYFVVWERQADGSWLVKYDFGLGSPPQQ